MTKIKGFFKPSRIIVQKAIEPGKREAIISIILSVFALLIRPLYVGLAALIFGILAYKRGQRGLGMFAIFMAIIFSIIGIILSILAYSSFDSEFLEDEVSAIGGILLLAF